MPHCGGEENKIRFNKITIKTFLLITLPLALQNLITVSVNLVDNLMVGTLGDAAIATVNSANQFFFIYSLFVFGAISGSGVFMAQFWGKRDFGGIRKTAGLCAVITLFAGIVIGLFSFLSPETIMRIFSRDEAVITQGAIYIKITAVTYPLTAATLTASAVVKNVERVKLPLFSSLVAICVNIVFNYLLIFGKFGFPCLGVAGAAYATALARVVECVLIFVLMLSQVKFVTQGVRDYFSASREFIAKYFKTSLPVILNETLWSIGLSVYVVVYSRLGSTPEQGTAAVAAVNISSLAEKLCSVFAMGMAYAVSIIIGKEIGSGRRKRAFYDASQFSVLAFLSGVIFGIVMVVLSPLFIRLFSISPQANEYARHLIIILACALAFKNFTLIGIVGIFRGGGDTLFSCLLDVGSVWLIGVPCVLITGLWLQLPLEVVFISSLIEELFKFVLTSIRIKNKRWLHDLVN